MSLKNKVSFVYEGIMNASFLEIDPPREEFANCLDCHLCVNEKSPRAQTKCCDYHPVLPNYMIGAILSDERTSLKLGKSRIEEKITQKIGVTPYGIMASQSHYKLFQKTRKHKEWPIKMDIDGLLCPFNDNGLCTIWDYRSELCAAFHCNSNGGQAGKRFWNIFFRYLTTIETSIVQHVLLEIGYPVQKLNVERVTPQSFNMEEEDGSINESIYQNTWDIWRGREKEFYISCYQIFKSLDEKKYLSIVGQKGAILEEKLRLGNAKFKGDLIPEFLIYADSEVKKEQVNQAFVKLNGVTVNLLIAQLLKLFDGKTRTYDVVRKSLIMHRPMSNMIKSFMKNGILKEAKIESTEVIRQN